MIYLHRISDSHIGQEADQNLKYFRRLCRQEALRNVVIVTTRWEEVHRATGEEREEELSSEDSFFKPELKNGARLLRHDNTPESAEAIIKAILDHEMAQGEIRRFELS